MTCKAQCDLTLLTFLTSHHSSFSTLTNRKYCIPEISNGVPTLGSLPLAVLPPLNALPKIFLLLVPSCHSDQLKHHILRDPLHIHAMSLPSYSHSHHRDLSSWKSEPLPELSFTCSLSVFLPLEGQLHENRDVACSLWVYVQR